MKPPKIGRPSAKKPPAKPSPPSGFPGAQFAAALTRSWGPLLAFIAFVSVTGILAMQFARSDSIALGISAIVVVALLAALVGRIKNVL
jgi:hypothetical protein